MGFSGLKVGLYGFVIHPYFLYFNTYVSQKLVANENTQPLGLSAELCFCPCLYPFLAKLQKMASTKIALSPRSAIPLRFTVHHLTIYTNSIATEQRLFQDFLLRGADSNR